MTRCSHSLSFLSQHFAIIDLSGDVEGLGETLGTRTLVLRYPVSLNWWWWIGHNTQYTCYIPYRSLASILLLGWKWSGKNAINPCFDCWVVVSSLKVIMVRQGGQVSVIISRMGLCWEVAGCQDYCHINSDFSVISVGFYPGLWHQSRHPTSVLVGSNYFDCIFIINM